MAGGNRELPVTSSPAVAANAEGEEIEVLESTDVLPVAPEDKWKELFDKSESWISCHEVFVDNRGSSFSRDTRTSLSPATSSSSSGGIPRRSQASQETQSLQHVLGRPRGLFLMGHAWKTSPGSRPEGFRIRCPSYLVWLLSMGLQ